MSALSSHQSNETRQETRAAESIDMIGQYDINTWSQIARNCDALESTVKTINIYEESVDDVISTQNTITSESIASNNKLYYDEKPPVQQASAAAAAAAAGRDSNKQRIDRIMRINNSSVRNARYNQEKQRQISIYNRLQILKQIQVVRDKKSVSAWACVAGASIITTTTFATVIGVNVLLFANPSSPAFWTRSCLLIYKSPMMFQLFVDVMNKLGIFTDGKKYELLTLFRKIDQNNLGKTDSEVEGIANALFGVASEVTANGAVASGAVASGAVAELDPITILIKTISTEVKKNDFTGSNIDRDQDWLPFLLSLASDPGILFAMKQVQIVFQVYSFYDRVKKAYDNETIDKYFVAKELATISTTLTIPYCNMMAENLTKYLGDSTIIMSGLGVGYANDSLKSAYKILSGTDDDISFAWLVKVPLVQLMSSTQKAAIDFTIEKLKSDKVSDRLAEVENAKKQKKMKQDALEFEGKIIKLGKLRNNNRNMSNDELFDLLEPYVESDKYKLTICKKVQYFSNKFNLLAKDPVLFCNTLFGVSTLFIEITKGLCFETVLGYLYNADILFKEISKDPLNGLAQFGKDSIGEKFYGNVVVDTLNSTFLGAINNFITTNRFSNLMSYIFTIIFGSRQSIAFGLERWKTQFISDLVDDLQTIFSDLSTAIMDIIYKLEAAKRIGKFITDIEKSSIIGEYTVLCVKKMNSVFFFLCDWFIKPMSGPAFKYGLASINTKEEIKFISNLAEHIKDKNMVSMLFAFINNQVSNLRTKTDFVAALKDFWNLKTIIRENIFGKKDPENGQWVYDLNMQRDLNGKMIRTTDNRYYIPDDALHDDTSSISAVGFDKIQEVFGDTADKFETKEVVGSNGVPLTDKMIEDLKINDKVILDDKLIHRQEYYNLHESRQATIDNYCNYSKRFLLIKGFWDSVEQLDSCAKLFLGIKTSVRFNKASGLLYPDYIADLKTLFETEHIKREQKMKDFDFSYVSVPFDVAFPNFIQDMQTYKDESIKYESIEATNTRLWDLLIGKTIDFVKECRSYYYAKYLKTLGSEEKGTIVGFKQFIWQRIQELEQDKSKKQFLELAMLNEVFVFLDQDSSLLDMAFSGPKDNDHDIHAVFDSMIQTKTIDATTVSISEVAGGKIYGSLKSEGMSVRILEFSTFEFFDLPRLFRYINPDIGLLDRINEDNKKTLIERFGDKIREIVQSVVLMMTKFNRDFTGINELTLEQNLKRSNFDYHKFAELMQNIAPPSTRIKAFNAVVSVNPIEGDVNEEEAQAAANSISLIDELLKISGIKYTCKLNGIIEYYTTDLYPDGCTDKKTIEKPELEGYKLSEYDVKSILYRPEVMFRILSKKDFYLNLQANGDVLGMFATIYDELGTKKMTNNIILDVMSETIVNMKGPRPLTEAESESIAPLVDLIEIGKLLDARSQIDPNSTQQFISFLTRQSDEKFSSFSQKMKEEKERYFGEICSVPEFPFDEHLGPLGVVEEGVKQVVGVVNQQVEQLLNKSKTISLSIFKGGLDQLQFVDKTALGVDIPCKVDGNCNPYTERMQHLNGRIQADIVNSSDTAFQSVCSKENKDLVEQYFKTKKLWTQEQVRRYEEFMIDQRKTLYREFIDEYKKNAADIEKIVKELDSFIPKNDALIPAGVGSPAAAAGPVSPAGPVAARPAGLSGDLPSKTPSEAAADKVAAQDAVNKVLPPESKKTEEATASEEKEENAETDAEAKKLEEDLNLMLANALQFAPLDDDGFGVLSGRIGSFLSGLLDRVGSTDKEQQKTPDDKPKKNKSSYEQCSAIQGEIPTQRVTPFYDVVPKNGLDKQTARDCTDTSLVGKLADIIVYVCSWLIYFPKSAIGITIKRYTSLIGGGILITILEKLGDCLMYFPGMLIYNAIDTNATSTNGEFNLASAVLAGLYISVETRLINYQQTHFSPLQKDACTLLGASGDYQTSLKMIMDNNRANLGLDPLITNQKYIEGNLIGNINLGVAGSSLLDPSVIPNILLSLTLDESQQSQQNYLLDRVKQNKIKCSDFPVEFDNILICANSILTGNDTGIQLLKTYMFCRLFNTETFSWSLLTSMLNPSYIFTFKDGLRDLSIDLFVFVFSKPALHEVVVANLFGTSSSNGNHNFMHDMIMGHINKIKNDASGTPKTKQALEDSLRTVAKAEFTKFFDNLLSIFNMFSENKKDDKDENYKNYEQCISGSCPPSKFKRFLEGAMSRLQFGKIPRVGSQNAPEDGTFTKGWNWLKNAASGAWSGVKNLVSLNTDDDILEVFDRTDEEFDNFKNANPLQDIEKRRNAGLFNLFKTPGDKKQGIIDMFLSMFDLQLLNQDKQSTNYFSWGWGKMKAILPKFTSDFDGAIQQHLGLDELRKSLDILADQKRKVQIKYHTLKDQPRSALTLTEQKFMDRAAEFLGFNGGNNQFNNRIDAIKDHISKLEVRDPLNLYKIEESEIKVSMGIFQKGQLLVANRSWFSPIVSPLARDWLVLKRNCDVFQTRILEKIKELKTYVTTFDNSDYVPNLDQNETVEKLYEKLSDFWGQADITIENVRSLLEVINEAKVKFPTIFTAEGPNGLMAKLEFTADLKKARTEDPMSFSIKDHDLKLHLWEQFLHILQGYASIYKGVVDVVNKQNPFVLYYNSFKVSPAIGIDTLGMLFKFQDKMFYSSKVTGRKDRFNIEQKQGQDSVVLLDPYADPKQFMEFIKKSNQNQITWRSRIESKSYSFDNKHQLTEVSIQDSFPTLVIFDTGILTTNLDGVAGFKQLLSLNYTIDANCVMPGPCTYVYNGDIAMYSKVFADFDVVKFIDHSNKREETDYLLNLHIRDLCDDQNPSTCLTLKSIIDNCLATKCTMLEELLSKFPLSIFQEHLDNVQINVNMPDSTSVGMKNEFVIRYTNDNLHVVN